MLNKNCGGRHHLPHLFSPHSFQSLLRFVSICFFCMSSQREVVTGDSLLVSCTWLRWLQSIMYQPERQTLLISGQLLCQCPFTRPMRMKVAGWVTLSKAEEPLQIYTIHPSVGHGAFPLAQSCYRPDSPQSCLSISHTRQAHRGVVITKGQFVILVSLHHRSHYLGLLSIKKKLLMWARKCVLCHYATEATDFTLYWFKLNEPEAITPVKKDHNYANVNYLELLSCAPLETPRLILMLIFCVLIALQHKALDGVGTSTVGGSSY